MRSPTRLEACLRTHVSYAAGADHIPSNGQISISSRRPSGASRWITMLKLHSAVTHRAPEALGFPVASRGFCIRDAILLTATAILQHDGALPWFPCWLRRSTRPLGSQARPVRHTARPITSPQSLRSVAYTSNRISSIIGVGNVGW